MRILGIDPGLNITGYGLINTKAMHFSLIEAGIIKPPKNSKIEARLKNLFQSLLKLIEDSKPEVIVLEKLYSHYRHPVTACLLGHARGIICLAASLKGVCLFEYSATRIKKAICGQGNASKYQVKNLIQDQFGIKAIAPSDVSDALALAIAHTHISKRNHDSKNLWQGSPKK